MSISPAGLGAENDCAGEGQQQFTRPNLKLYTVNDRIINEFGAVCGISIGRGSPSTRRKPTPISFCPSQMVHDRPCIELDPELKEAGD
jgi:hypothetical protein